MKQWHGPALIAALEGGRIPTAAYVSYRGNLTKCSVEHLRPASTLERLVATEWEDIINEMIDSTEGPEPDETGDDLGHPSEPPPGEVAVPEVAQPEPQAEVPQASSRGVRGVQYPYPFSSQEIYPLIQVASGLSAGGAPSMTSTLPRPSRTPSKTSEQQSDVTGGRQPTALPEVAEEHSAAGEQKVEDDAKAEDPAVSPIPDILSEAGIQPDPPDNLSGGRGRLEKA